MQKPEMQYSPLKAVIVAFLSQWTDLRIVLVGGGGGGATDEALCITDATEVFNTYANNNNKVR